MATMGMVVRASDGQKFGVIFHRRQNDQTVDLALLQQPNPLCINRGLTARVGKKDGIPRRAEHGFRPVDNRRKQGIRDVRNDEANRARGPAPQSLGQQIGRVTEAACCLVHAGAHLVADSGPGLRTLEIRNQCPLRREPPPL